MQSQIQNQTNAQNPIQTLEKALEFLKTQLSQEGVSIKLPTPLREEWELIVYKVKNQLEYLILKKAKKYEEEGEENPLRKAKSEILEKVLKAKEIATEIEKELKTYPIKFMLNIDVDSDKIYLCVTLNKYVDRKVFNSFVDTTKKIKLTYISGMNCKEI